MNVSSIVAGPQAVCHHPCSRIFPQFQQPGVPYYAIAKAALDQYTRSTAIDLIPHGIRVNSVSPGVIATGFLGAMGLPDPASKKVSFVSAAKTRRIDLRCTTSSPPKKSVCRSGAAELQKRLLTSSCSLPIDPSLLSSSDSLLWPTEDLLWLWECKLMTSCQFSASDWKNNKL